MDYEKLKEDLDKGLIGPQQLLSGTKVLTESSRESPEYLDRGNLPFWYHLGKHIKHPARVVQFGPRLGLPATCFLQSRLVSGSWCIVGDPNNVTESNTRLHLPEKTLFHFWKWENFKPDFVWSDDGEFFWGLGFVTEDYGDKCKEYLGFMWNNIVPGGLLVCDYINSDAQGEAFHDFCRVKNREPVTFKTRYGVGILER